MIAMIAVTALATKSAEVTIVCCMYISTGKPQEALMMFLWSVSAGPHLLGSMAHAGTIGSCRA